MELFNTYMLLLLSFFMVMSYNTTMAKENQTPSWSLPFTYSWKSIQTRHQIKPHKSLADLAKIYGPLMTLKLGTVTTIVVSSPTIAKEVLQKNDLAFSSRTIPYVVRALDHHNHSMAWLPVSLKWRSIRKVSSTQLFAAQRLESNQFLRKQKVLELVAYVEENCNNSCAVDIGQVAFSTVLNLISNTVFSIDLTQLDSNHAQDFKARVWGVMEDVARPNFADYFPLLSSIDPQKIKYHVERHFLKFDQLFDGMIKQRLESRKLDNSTTSSSSDFLDAILDYKQEDGFQLSDPDIKSLLKDIFIAGTDTTSSTVEWVMTELLRNPEKMQKIQAELKETIGEQKLIDESDIVHLPYLQATVKETFRMHPPIPLLLPHKAESMVELCGYIVPKNAQVLVNVWTMGRDPNIWDNPTSFEPERFLNSKMDFKGQDFELIPFGAGRRICPGLPLAYRMVYLMLASLLHAFNWKLEDGLQPKDMDMEENFGLTLQKAIPINKLKL